MSIRPDFEDMARTLGCVPGPDIARYSIAEFLGAHLYRVYRDVAVREHSSILAVVRDVLRKNAEGEA